MTQCHIPREHFAQQLKQLVVQTVTYSLTREGRR